ncbi:MAG TPA: TetR/AcrR family transcriptional regulator [Ktedonobacterales bacterium]
MKATDAPDADVAPTRGARRKSETRRRLLAAARGVFAREGLEAATIAQITQAADVGFGTFYLHFATKEDAYRAVVTEGFDELARLLTVGRAEAVAAGEPWWEQVRLGVCAYCHFAERNRELFQVMFAGGAAGIGLGHQLQLRFADLLATQLGEAAAEARTRDGQPTPYRYPARMAALATVVTLTRTTLWWLTREADEPDEPRPTLDEFTATLAHYITAALWGQTPAER